MSDYKEMYILLFQSMTRAITLMQEAQQKTEEFYLSSEPLDIKVLDISKLKEDSTTENDK